MKVDIVKQMENFRLEVQMEAGREPVALLGGSGSGKSDVLRCIAGTLTPDEGRILLNGKTFFDSSRHINIPPQRRQIGLLLQSHALFPHMTVRQNIAVSVRRKDRRVPETMEKLHQFHLEEDADKYPRQISVVQRQRTALARIFASEPSMLLLDEPLAALDSYLKSQLEAELQECLSGFEGPVLWASHDRGEIYRNCRYVCVLDHGMSQEPVTVAGLIAHPGTESAARLSGCKNFIDAVARGNNNIYLPKWGVTLRCAYPLPPFLWRVGIRAHQVHLSEPEHINAFAVDVVRTVEDVSIMILLLRPSGAALDAPLLRMELEKSDWLSVPDKRHLTVSIGPQDILLLR